MEWEYGWEGFLDASSRTIIFVTGEIENVGSAYAEEFDMECQLLAEDSSVIASSRRRLRSFDENEEQLFYYKFVPDESEADRIDDVAVEGTFPDE
jgi:hypothetical protein